MDEIATKRKVVVLTDDEKYIIYCYAVKNHCISQNGEYWKFRVQPSEIANEINDSRILERKISGHHAKASITEVIEWEYRFNKFPEPQETAEIEQLKIKCTRNENEAAKLKLENEKLQKMIKETITNYETIFKQQKDKIDKIKNIIN